MTTIAHTGILVCDMKMNVVSEQAEVPNYRELVVTPGSWLLNFVHFHFNEDV